MELRAVLESAHSAAVLCVGWWNGKLFTGSEDGTIKIWDHETLRLDRTLTAHTSAVSCIECCSDIKAVFSASTDGTVICWTWNSGMKPLCSEKLMVPISGLAWDATRHLLIVAGKDVVFVLSLEDGKRFVHARKPIKVHRDYMTSIATSEGKVVTGSFDRSIQMFDPVTGRRLLNIPDAHQAGVSALCFDPERETIISGSYDQRAKVWTKDGTELHELRGFTDVVQGIAVNPVTGMLWVVANSPTPIIFDPSNGANVTGFMSALVPTKGADTRLFQRIKFLNETKEMVGITNLRELVLWRFNERRPITSIYLSGSPHCALACCQESVCVNAPLEEVYSAEADGCVWVWEPATPNREEITYRKRQIGGHGTAVLCMAYDEGLRALITGCEDHTVRIWGHSSISREGDQDAAEEAAGSTAAHSAAGLSVPASLTEHKEKVSALAVAVHPETGKHWAISGGWDGFLCVWNTSAAQLAWKVEGAHDSHILDLAYSPKDNEFAVSTAGEGSVHVWSLDKRKLVRCLAGHDGEVTQVRWNNRTEQWVTGSHDHTIRTWAPDGSAMQCIETEGGITAMCIDTDSGRLVVAGADHTLQLYNTESTFDTPIRVGVGHEDAVIAVVHVSKKAQYVTTSWDRTLRVWRALGSDPDDPTALPQSRRQSAASKRQQVDEAGDPEQSTSQ